MKTPFQQAAQEAGAEEAQQALVDLEGDLAIARKRLQEIQELAGSLSETIDRAETALAFMYAPAFYKDTPGRKFGG